MTQAHKGSALLIQDTADVLNQGFSRGALHLNLDKAHIIQQCSSLSRFLFFEIVVRDSARGLFNPPRISTKGVDGGISTDGFRRRNFDEYISTSRSPSPRAKAGGGPWGSLPGRLLAADPAALPRGSRYQPSCPPLRVPPGRTCIAPPTCLTSLGLFASTIAKEC